jgi:putative endonuclease
MAKTERRKLGDIGEGVACKYLEQRGYRIVERNYLKPWGEIDIVARKGNKLYFVEVKTVSRDTEGDTDRGEGTRVTYRPEENVHPAKLKRLHRAIQTYLLDHKVPESTVWQIDVACVHLDFATLKAKVEVLENVVM